MCNKHKHYDMIITWANGHKIQYSRNKEYWADDLNPTWEHTCYYRVKPKPKVKKWQLVFSSPIETKLQVTGAHFSSFEEFNRIYPDLKAIQNIDSTMIEVEE